MCCRYENDYYLSCIGNAIKHLKKTETMTKQEIKINIDKLKETISMNTWNKGYVENCKYVLKFYESLLNK